MKFPFKFSSLALPEMVCELPRGVNRGIRQFRERNDVVVFDLGKIAPKGERDGKCEGARRREDEAWHMEVTGEVVGPAEEEV